MQEDFIRPNQRRYVDASELSHWIESTAHACSLGGWIAPSAHSSCWKKNDGRFWSATLMAKTRDTKKLRRAICSARFPASAYYTILLGTGPTTTPCALE